MVQEISKVTFDLLPFVCYIKDMYILTYTMKLKLLITDDNANEIDEWDIAVNHFHD